MFVVARCYAGPLHPVDGVRLHLPYAVADYVDFYASEHHATNVGRIFRPDGEPLPAAWKHLPIGYHGRASSIRVSGQRFKRPQGQTKAPDAEVPTFGPSKRLDYELELGFLIGRGNELGEPIPIADAEQHLFGVTLLNDWSARDLQAWEYQPLGPFLSKSFASTLSHRCSISITRGRRGAGARTSTAAERISKQCSSCRRPTRPSTSSSPAR